MEYRFDEFLVQIDHGELCLGAEPVAIEPLAFSLLVHLIENAGRLVTKDELVEKVWERRFISDAAISTVVKSVRRALGDDGTTQKYVKTVRGRGFRFVGRVTMQVPGVAANYKDTQPEPEMDRKGQAPTLAILPFNLIGDAENRGAIADGLPAELITTLSRLRWLKVIARGSSFRFHGPDIDIEQVRVALGATYVLTGEIEIFGPRAAVNLELVDCRSARIVWADRLSGPLADVHQLREEISIRVISMLEQHIPQHEAQLARTRNPALLDAWAFYHTGLQHMYRFNKADNALADGYFRRALELDQDFARAYGALSFTSFQSAFLRYEGDRGIAIEAARRHALRGMELDPLDPFINYNLGRSYWLEGAPQAGFGWLEQATVLSPNFAHGLYSRGWAEIMAGDGAAALEHISRAVDLSPIDPLLYAMFSAKGLAYLHTGEFDQAAIWAERGARKPGAHFLIKAISAAAWQIAGQHDKAVFWRDQSLAARPETSSAMFFSAFPFRDEETRERLRDALLRLGFPEQ
ncbi:Transcriptional regulator HilA [Roseovarius litorisediminis]|uniref:Transcriptional regulator HilA n=1 Tax=Roseovarius litorisediminis TaxID=1312363 RepID=A0A1Y5S3G0_9RHOB|nr:winged helix-turn-helix domain-containing protein [Roseovarius litorisediminis]SLN31818.1 Transcriptional regulator HilA [Roseovarius litorisediminis]